MKGGGKGETEEDTEPCGFRVWVDDGRSVLGYVERAVLAEKAIY